MLALSSALGVGLRTAIQWNRTVFQKETLTLARLWALTFPISSF